MGVLFKAIFSQLLTKVGTCSFFQGSLSLLRSFFYHGSLSLLRYFWDFPCSLFATSLLKKWWFTTLSFLLRFFKGTVSRNCLPSFFIKQLFLASIDQCCESGYVFYGSRSSFFLNPFPDPVLDPRSGSGSGSGSRYQIQIRIQVRIWIWIQVRIWIWIRIHKTAKNNLFRTWV